MKCSFIVLVYISLSILLMADRRSNFPSGPFCRSSNHDRARWRDVCRKDLIRHISESSSARTSRSKALRSRIEQQLDFDVNPAEVRLVPSPTDPYVWQYGLSRSTCFESSSAGTSSARIARSVSIWVTRSKPCFVMDSLRGPQPREMDTLEAGLCHAEMALNKRPMAAYIHTFSSLS